MSEDSGDAIDFRFSEQEWQTLAAQLEDIGRLNSGGERWLIELTAGIFVHTRRAHGKGRHSPKKARAAWLWVADAADELQAAIRALRPAGAADFSMLDNHSQRIAEWAAFLPSVAEGARVAAEYEMFGVEPTPNNADPVRDNFLRQIIGVWRGYGGQARASVDAVTGKPKGPLVRFVSAAAGPAFAAVGEPPPTPGVIRQAIRAHPDYGK